MLSWVKCLQAMHPLCTPPSCTLPPDKLQSAHMGVQKTV